MTQHATHQCQSKTAQDLYELMQIQIDLQREMLNHLQTISTFSSQRPNPNQEELSQLRMDMLRFVFNNYSGTFYDQKQHLQPEETTAATNTAPAGAGVNSGSTTSNRHTKKSGRKNPAIQLSNDDSATSMQGMTSKVI